MTMFLFWFEHIHPLRLFNMELLSTTCRTNKYLPIFVVAPLWTGGWFYTLEL
jgi:hypothetical protein